MLMVRIVDMAVLMFQFDMGVFVDVALGQMNPETDTHENSGKDKAIRQRFTKERDGQHCADKWCQREICSSSSSAEMAQGKNEEHQADANGHETDSGGDGNHWQGRELRT